MVESPGKIYATECLEAKISELLRGLSSGLVAGDWLVHVRMRSGLEGSGLIPKFQRCDRFQGLVARDSLVHASSMGNVLGKFNQGIVIVSLRPSSALAKWTLIKLSSTSFPDWCAFLPFSGIYFLIR
jgi:hypothetical protein